MTARAVMLATGADLKKLGVPGEERLAAKACQPLRLMRRAAAARQAGRRGRRRQFRLQEALTLAETCAEGHDPAPRRGFSGQAPIATGRSHPKIEIEFNPSPRKSWARTA